MPQEKDSAGNGKVPKAVIDRKISDTQVSSSEKKDEKSEQNSANQDHVKKRSESHNNKTCKESKICELKKSNSSLFGFAGKGRRLSLVVGILLGLGVPYALHILGFYSMDVLDEYVERSHEALRVSQELLLARSGGDKLIGQLREFMDFTPRLSPRAELRPGQRLKMEGVRAKHPVVLMPGIVTTGLELWDAEPCAKTFFRQRMWGTMTMVQNMMLNTKCWLRHMALNHTSGKDPENIKLRPAQVWLDFARSCHVHLQLNRNLNEQGFEAADYVLGGYWVWQKLIENLADIGYDPSNMFLAGYDWRLSFRMLEVRDQYFTRLTGVIEAMVQGNNGTGVVVVTHSMGGNVFLYYLQWVSAYLGPGWIDAHIHSFVSIATPFLGVAKGISALLSGEARDTAELGLLGTVLDQYISPWDRRTLFRTWGSSPVMFPKGGNLFWGGWVNESGHVQGAVDTPNETKAALLSNFVYWDDSADTAIAAAVEVPTSAAGSLPRSAGSAHPEDRKPPIPDVNRSPAAPPSTADVQAAAAPKGPRGTTLEETIDYLLESSASGADADGMLSQYHETYTHHLREEPFPKQEPRQRCIPLGRVCEKDGKSKREQREPVYRKEWTNPLNMQLPPAKNMKIYCLYGVGKDTERAYYYRSTGLQANSTCPSRIRQDSPWAENSEASSRPMQTAWVMDKTKESAYVTSGMIKVDGDGCVPLLSLGYMCTEGWRKQHFNPAGIEMNTREYKHSPVSFMIDPRGGPYTADHVDIMGNHDLIEDVLKAASGLDLEDRYLSNIQEIARKIPLPKSIQ